MSTPWSLYNEVNKNNNRNYSVYRCIEPSSIVTDGPWYPNQNICPCDPSLSNKTGRGFTACPIGIEEPIINMNINKNDTGPYNSQIKGNLYSSSQFTPPQLMPRPITKIGYQWRAGS